MDICGQEQHGLGLHNMLPFPSPDELDLPRAVCGVWALICIIFPLAFKFYKNIL